MSSLSAIVGIVASHRLDAVSGGEVGKVTFETMAPIYFGHQRSDARGITIAEQWAESGHRVYDPKTGTSRTDHWPTDSEWKREQFPTPEVQ